MKRTIVAMTALATLGLVPGVGAGEWGVCNGKPIKWRSNIHPLVLHRNTCTIPDGAKAALYFNAIDQWQYAGVFMNGEVGLPATDCALFDRDDVSEVGIIDPTEIDDRLGLTLLAFNSGCGPLTGRFGRPPMSFVETDVAIRNDFPSWNDPFEGTDGSQAWDTMAHELGHAFGGFLEDGQWFSVMSVRNEPLVGGTGIHATLMPRDRYRIHALYGRASDVVNLAASPQIVQDNLEIHLGDPPALTRVCRGDWVTVTFTLLNQSSGFGVGLFRNRVRVSTEFNGHNGDGWTVADWDDSLAAWQDKRIPVSFTVPLDFPLNQAGYIYVDVDWWAEVDESTETDNHIKIMELLHVVC